MKLIIPSSIIHDIRNKKILDNKISEVNTNAKDITIVNKYNEFVYKFSEGISEPTLGAARIDKQDNKNPIYSGTAAISVALGYTIIPQIRIPKKGKNKYINKIYYGKNSNNQDNINVVVKGIKYIGTVDFFVTSFSNIKYTSSAPFTQRIVCNFSHTYNAPSAGPVTVVTQATSEDNVGTIVPTENETEYILNNLKVLTSAEILKGHTYTTSGLSENKGDGAEKYVPQSLEISINGDIITLNIEEISSTFQWLAGGIPFSTDSNDFIQEGNLAVEGLPLITKNTDNILVAFSNGKETATIKCVGGYVKVGTDFPVEHLPYHTTDVIDGEFVYKDGMVFRGKDWEVPTQDIHIDFILNGERGSTVIPKGEIKSEFFFLGEGWETYQCTILNYYAECSYFNIGDIVRPMVYTNNGDIPMSVKKDGTPKDFRVTGNKINYDGHITQELTLQEV